jgi:diketogulonate reductase-like aldo/keto reductase
MGLGADDWAAWRAMEELHASGRVSLLGISNVTLEQLQRLVREAAVPPRFVQNRCYASRGWDREVRAFCRSAGMVYQAFSLLTANREYLNRREIAAIARRHNRTVPQIIFRFALDVGMLPLTGTSDAGHMQQDLAVFEFQLDATEVALIDDIARQ